MRRQWLASAAAPLRARRFPLSSRAYSRRPAEIHSPHCEPFVTLQWIPGSETAPTPWSGIFSSDYHPPPSARCSSGDAALPNCDGESPRERTRERALRNRRHSAHAPRAIGAQNTLHSTACPRAATADAARRNRAAKRFVVRARIARPRDDVRVSALPAVHHPPPGSFERHAAHWQRCAHAQ